jgi:uncharacterized lipoprotein YddW (UPF0748 family)
MVEDKFHFYLLSRTMKRLIFLTFLLMLCQELFSQPKTEIRAVWLATNYSLDWPVKPFYNREDIGNQQENLIKILDKLEEANFNLVFIQTRLRGDVIYHSKIESLSAYISPLKNTGYDYDPLAFAINECHKRGMECHAWFVTYPLGADIKNKSTFIINNPTLALKQKGEYFLDPGNPRTNQYLLSLIKEIVSNYDIDGLHLDYVRYPEKIQKSYDENTYKKYGNNKDLNQWRRENINQFVYAVYDTVKALKPWVQVSSSVVGMYDKLLNNDRNHWTAYRSVYQDPIDWIQKGKHDFIVPMMYYDNHLFFPFIDDWIKRSEGRWLIPGIGLYQMDEKESDWNVQSVIDQIHYSREHCAQGNAFYRTRYLMDNKKGIMDLLMKNYFTFPALLPPLTWLDNTPPPAPEQPDVSTSEDWICVHWDSASVASNKSVSYNIYRSETFPIDLNNAQNLLLSHCSDTSAYFSYDKNEIVGHYYLITSYDRYHNESEGSPCTYFVLGKEENDSAE